MKRILFILVTLFLFCVNGQAQFSTQLLPIYVDYSMWNPAAISPAGLFNGGINYFNDSYGGTPNTKMMNASFHYPIRFKKIAFGAHLTRQNFSNLKQTNFALGTRYKINFSDYTAVAAGIGGGIYFTGQNTDDLLAFNPDDPLISPDDFNSINFNINAGILFRHAIVSGFASTEQVQKITVGFSMKQILPSIESLYDDGFEIDRSNQYFTLLGYSHPILVNVGTTLYYTNSYEVGHRMNHSLSLNFDFYEYFDLDVGYNTGGRVFAATGFGFSNIRADDRLRLKVGLTYETRSLIQANPVGVTFSMMYTYDYDFTYHEY